MNKISDYRGTLLNHLEANYRPGDRDLAVEFVEALGLVAAPLEFTKTSPRPLIAIHPNKDDRDPTTNVIFIYEMAPAQTELDMVLRKKLEADPELKQAMSGFRTSLQQYPGGSPHFGLRYQSTEELEPVLDRLKKLSPKLQDRVTVNEMPPYPVKEGMPAIRQIFVHTDVLTTSPAGFGQLVELQVERGR